jgi:hypothetical protein
MSENNPLYEAFKVITNGDNSNISSGMQKLAELTVKEKLDSYKHETLLSSVDKKINKVMGLYREEKEEQL